jgi:hypothetical protein
MSLFVLFLYTLGASVLGVSFFLLVPTILFAEAISISYVLHDDRIEIRILCSTRSIPYSAIESVEEDTDYTPAAALSSKRIKIRHSEGDADWISPKEFDSFKKELEKRVGRAAFEP